MKTHREPGQGKPRNVAPWESRTNTKQGTVEIGRSVDRKRDHAHKERKRQEPPQAPTTKECRDANTHVYGNSREHPGDEGTPTRAESLTLAALQESAPK